MLSVLVSFWVLNEFKVKSEVLEAQSVEHIRVSGHSMWPFCRLESCQQPSYMNP